MRRLVGWWLVAVTCAGMLAPAVAIAQRPVCPDPAPADLYYTACLKGGYFIVARLLADFSIDHLFKATSSPFTRQPVEVLRAFDVAKAIADDHAIVRYLERLEPVTFTRLDTATGVLQAAVPEEARVFAAAVDIAGDRYRLRWRLPPRLAGGYWRTPAALQMAFWEESRAALRVKSARGLTFDAEITCVAVSTDGIRSVTSDPRVPSLLLVFDQCG